MRSEYRLLYRGQSEDTPKSKEHLVALLNSQYGIGKILEVADLVENPPFVVKRSYNRQELEVDSSRLRDLGAETLIIRTTSRAEALAKQIEKDFIPTRSPKSSLPKEGFGAFFAKYSRSLNNILQSMDVKSVEKLVDELLSARERKSQIIIIGNGGSAAAASHLATDLAKQRFDDESTMFRVMSLADNSAWFSATANDFGYENVFVQQLKTTLQPEDLLIAISSSGESPNILNAVEYADKKGARTVGIVGFDGGKLKSSARHVIHIPTKKGQYGYMEDVVGILAHMVSIHLFEHDCAIHGNKR